MTTPTKLARIIVAAALVATLIAAIVPSSTAPTLGASDKINHICAFIVLTILTAWALPRVSPVWIALALSGYGALIEVIQAIPVLGRDAEAADWIADTAAVLITLAIVALLRRGWKWARATGGGCGNAGRPVQDDML